MEVITMAHAAGGDVVNLDTQRDSHDNESNSSLDLKSISASQASQPSSLGEPVPSQLNGQQAPKDTSQASASTYAQFKTPEPQTIAQVENDVASPQAPPVDGNTATIAPAVPRINTTFLVTDGTNARQHVLQSDLKQGQKRTANGHIKTPSSSTMTSPGSATTKGHTRQSSSTSQVSELSAQLRARLSYAMVKVQHGWESRTIDEVETLASQQPSPLSTTASPRRTTFNSPPTFIQSSERTTLPPTTSLTAPHANLNGTLSCDHAYPPSQPGYAYTPTMPPESATSTGAPSLAPPVDFSRKTNSRRISQPRAPQASLLNGARQPSNLSTTSSGSIHPATPPQDPRQPPTLQQTPSQRTTAMEVDAIETLLFMSSPGNSQTFANTQANQPYPNGNHIYGQNHTRNGTQPGTPLRTGFMPEETRVAPRKKELWENGELKDEASIDRVLDQMGDGESSSDEEDGPLVGRAGAGVKAVYA